MKQKNLAVELLKKLISENEALLANDKSAQHLWNERYRIRHKLYHMINNAYSII